MTVSPLVNQVLCATTATLGLLLASYDGVFVSASHSRLLSDKPAHLEAPAAQTVNRAAKGDKLRGLPHADPQKQITPDGHSTPNRCEVVVAMLATVDPSGLHRTSVHGP